MKIMRIADPFDATASEWLVLAETEAERKLLPAVGENVQGVVTDVDVGDGVRYRALHLSRANDRVLEDEEGD